jgi:hypothetical protein
MARTRDGMCAVDGADVCGPYSGPPGGRFIYLSWGTVDDGGRCRDGSAGTRTINTNHRTGSSVTTTNVAAVTLATL